MKAMAEMWTFEGLSLRDLLRRTWSESWADAVYGQAGRMAFYHFIAIFPCLLIFLTLISGIPSLGQGLRSTAGRVVQQILPSEASAFLHQMTAELQRQTPAGLELVLTFVGALWAASNGMWALIFGLNVAYEVEETRNWWRQALVLVGLTGALAVAATLALVLLFSAVQLEVLVLHRPSPPGVRFLEWLAVLSLLMFSFALVFRFGPNLPNGKWKWSTPGSFCALLLWVVSTLGLRFYFGHITDYHRAYGHLNAVVMLLLWLYFTNAVILIGAEMNSEIRKAVKRD